MREHDFQTAARAWLAKSSSDLRSARLLMDADPPETDVAAFLSQQAAEKCLKGFLAYHGVDPPRTHDLGLLADLAAEHREALRALDDIARPLGRFAVEVRYPFIEDPPDREEAAQAVKRAGRICQRTRELLNMEK